MVGLPGTALAFVVDGDFQGFQELLVLGRQLDLSGRLKTAARSGRLRGGLGFHFLTLYLFAFFPLIEADGGLEDEEDVVACAFNVADGRRDAIGIGEGLVDRVSQLLHELFQSIFQVTPLSPCENQRVGFWPAPDRASFRITLFTLW